MPRNATSASVDTAVEPTTQTDLAELPDSSNLPAVGGKPISGARRPASTASSATKLYRVLRPLQHDDLIYGVNQGIKLTDDDAGPLLADGTIELPASAAPIVPAEPARLVPTPVAPVLTVPVAAVEVITNPTPATT